MSNEKYGFVYIWYDRKHKRYYVGCHWGTIDDGYICSSSWMKKAYNKRPEDFKRRIIKTGIMPRSNMYTEEQKYLMMIKPSEIKTRYYNLCLSDKNQWHQYPEKVKTIGQKISASKAGVSTGPCSPEKAKAISEAKKAAFQRKKQEVGYKFSEEHRNAISKGKKGYKHTQEWKDRNSEMMKRRHAETKRRKELQSQ